MKSGKEYPVMDMVRKDPQMAALISKLVTSREPARWDKDGDRRITPPDAFSFRSISDRLSENIKDAENVMKLLPEMELWAQILVSSILAPKDMVTTEINFVPPADLLPSDVSSAIISLMKTHYEQVYKIKPLLPKILRDVLFNRGSYPIAVIPENSLDQLINNNITLSMESLTPFIGTGKELPNIGLLGPAKKETQASTSFTSGISFESLNYNPSRDTGLNVQRIEGFGNNVGNIYVSDNPNLLRVPMINERLREQQISRIMGAHAMESHARTSRQKLSDFQITNLVYKHQPRTYNPLSVLKTSHQIHRRTIGEPLVMPLPSESVIPVHIPGRPEQQIGFFVLIDSEGNPLSRMSAEEQYRALGSRMSMTTNSFPSSMIDRVTNMMGENNAFNAMNQSHVDIGVRAYSELIEADLMARLRNGSYGNGVTIANNQEVYRIMLARSLQGQNTQLLFIPVELMTYFAFRYNDEGIGESHIDEIKILLSLRVMLMFSNVMASIKNSIGRTGVNIKLDDTDPNPKKSIEEAIHEIMRTRQQYFPLGINNPGDIVDWLQRAGYEFAFEGHPGLPDVKIDFTEKNTNYVKPDTDLEENLRKSSIMAVGLSPETIDSGMGAEFATTVVHNNLLLTKRVLQIQEDFTPQLSNHIRQYTFASQPLSDGIKKILMENIAKIKERLEETSKQVPDDIIIANVFVDFMNGMEVTLPSPNSATLENQTAALKTYIESLDAVLDSFISDKILSSEISGEITGSPETLREIIRAYLIRSWINENGMLPELGKLTATDEDGKPMVDFCEEQATHINALLKSMGGLMKKVKPIVEESNADLEASGIAPTAPTPSTDDSGSGDGGGGGDFDFSGGGDDIPGLDSSGSGTDNPPEETPAEDKPEGTETKPGEDKPEEGGDASSGSGE